MGLEGKKINMVEKQCREQGLIKPVGTSVTSAGVSRFYKPSQIAELKKKLKNK